jgi:hypothetical protein
MYFLIVKILQWDLGSYNSTCGVCGKGILREKCVIVNWKYVSMGVERL